jgi:hypothetical protein
LKGSIPVRTLMSILGAVMLLAPAAAAEPPVYTNADLGKPIVWRRTPSERELSGIKARQFVAIPPEEPPETNAVRIDPTAEAERPTAAPIVEWWRDNYPNRLDAGWQNPSSLIVPVGPFGFGTFIRPPHVHHVRASGRARH